MRNNKDFPGGSDGKESACSAGDTGFMPGSERSLGEGNGNPLWYSCLGKPMDRGAWWATVHGVTNRQQQAAVLLGSYDPTDPMILEVSNREAGWNL